MNKHGISLVVQWLVFTAEGVGLIPGWGTRSHKPSGTAKKEERKKHIKLIKLLVIYVCVTLFCFLVLAWVSLILNRKNKSSIFALKLLQIHLAYFVCFSFFKTHLPFSSYHKPDTMLGRPGGYNGDQDRQQSPSSHTLWCSGKNS